MNCRCPATTRLPLLTGDLHIPMRFSFSSSEGLKRGKLWRRSGTMHGLANYCFGCSSPFQRLCSSTKCPRNSVPVREKIESAVGRSGWSLRQPSTFDVLVLTSGQNAWLRTGEVLATARLFIGRKGLKQRATLSCQDSVWRVRTARKKSSRGTSATPNCPNVATRCAWASFRAQSLSLQFAENTSHRNRFGSVFG